MSFPAENGENRPCTSGFVRENIRLEPQPVCATAADDSSDDALDTVMRQFCENISAADRGTA